MKKYLPPFFLLLAFQTQLFAQINFSEHIAPIIYNKCSACHLKGDIGPMPLTNYDEISHYAEDCWFATSSQLMPPWMPSPNFSHFLNEKTISKEEIEMLDIWMKMSKPRGDSVGEPELPMFPKNSPLGKPDLSVAMNQSYIHKGDNKDEYRIFALPANIIDGRNVKAIEIVPGNPTIAHHIILGLDTTHYADKLDVKDTAYGYAQYAGFGFYPTYDNWSGWVPGNVPRFFPAGIGNYILPNSQVLLQMHYGPSASDERDSTTVNIFYSDKPVDRYIRTQLIGPNDIQDGPFFIPANQTKTFHAQYKIVDDYSLISVTPHGHWLCRSWEAFAVNPKGDTVPLIKIKSWDFNWQNFFAFPKLVKLEKGSVIYASATYDNTDNNWRNPNSPPKNVMWGESAKDEMFLFYFAYVPYKKGDEAIAFAGAKDDFTVTQKPDKTVSLDFEMIENSTVNLKLCNAAGKVEKQIINNQKQDFGKHTITLSTEGLKPGTYWCKFTSSYFSASKKLVVK